MITKNIDEYMSETEYAFDSMSDQFKWYLHRRESDPFFGRGVLPSTPELLEWNRAIDEARELVRTAQASNARD